MTRLLTVRRRPARPGRLRALAIAGLCLLVLLVATRPLLAQEPEQRDIVRDTGGEGAAAGGDADRIDLLLFDAETWLAEGNWNEAVRTLEAVLRAERGRVEVWQALARACRMALDADSVRRDPAFADSLALSAADAYRHVLELRPRDQSALNGLNLLAARFNSPVQNQLHSPGARRLWAEADSLRTAGAWARAAESLRLLGRLQPGVPAVQRLRGDALRRAGAPPEEIRRAFEQALRSNPADRAALVALARMDLAAGDTVSGEGRLRAAFELSPADTATQAALAALHDAGRPGSSEGAERLFYRGRLALARGDANRAAGYLGRAVAIDSAGADYRKFLGIAWYELRRFPEALDQLRVALWRQGDDRDIPFYIGACFFHLGHYEPAVAYLGPAANGHRPRGEAARLMALSLAHLEGQSGGVVFYLEQALREGSADPDIPCMLGEMYVRLDRWDDAERRFGECAALRPDHPAALLGQGLVADHRGHPGAAVGFLGRFLATQPASPAVLMRMGLAWLKLSQPDSALYCFRQVLASDTTFAELHPASLRETQVLDVVFIVLMAGRNTKDGIVVGERLVELEPANPGFANNLAMAYADAGHSLPRALELAERARAAGRDDPGVMDTVGWVLARMGRHREALRLLDEARRLTEADPRGNPSEIYFHLAWLLSDMKKTAEAIAWARKAIETADNPIVESGARELLEALEAERAPDNPDN